MKRLAVLFALVIALLPVLAWSAPAVEGRDYALIEDGAPYQPLAGKIEVAEVFAYWCDHCARFQPMVEAWQRKLPKDVRLSYVPLPSGRDDAFARGFFAVQDAGALAKAHAPLFAAVHDEQSVPRNPSIDELSAWYGQRGLDATKLRAAMASPSLADRLADAHRFAVRSGVEGTPTLIVNGRYRILGRSLEELLRNADAVIAQLRTPAR
jgi:thiol:disulfide interchange protein DsbA